MVEAGDRHRRDHGKGFLNANITNQRRIPIQWTDFIFSAIAEQFGLIGTIALLLLYTVHAVPDLAHRPAGA